MTSSKAPPAPGELATVDEAIDKNKQVAEEVKAAADELALVHAVLDKKLPDGVRAGDVAEAVARADEIEKRLDESGKILDQVNEKLEREVGSGAKSEP
jgi:ABC-type Fe3+-citrate transport system substrate-binding protein